ncbi:hypothetical protein Pd630_LPD03829 [Rhodococcus opacus PD630]|nr:hypothetical protein Pd630_LPD03829 [Rhodococcus opacus PD630]
MRRISVVPVSPEDRFCQFTVTSMQSFEVIAIVDGGPVVKVTNPGASAVACGVITASVGT